MQGAWPDREYSHVHSSRGTCQLQNSSDERPYRAHGSILRRTCTTHESMDRLFILPPEL